MTTSFSNTIPIAETFISIHGEGAWAGTRMTFFRTAGCNVGKWRGGNPNASPFPFLSTGAESTECTTYDGRHFPCDTDYSKTEDVSVDDLIKRIPVGVKHVCITGGEPLLHQSRLFPLVRALEALQIKTHWETSGTIAAETWLRGSNSWITCSPKNGYLRTFVEDIADEIRIMVDKHITTLPAGVENCRGQVFLCPISDPTDVNKFDRESIDTCFKLIGQLPKARISIQMHKFLNVR